MSTFHALATRIDSVLPDGGAVSDGWAAGLANLDAALVAAEAVRAEADRAGRRAARKLIADADPPAPDPLRARLACADPDSGTARPGRCGAGSAGRHRGHHGWVVDRGRRGRGARRASRRAAWPVRRVPVEATRLGVTERPDVLAAGDGRDLLWTRPCDLAAATVAVVGDQRLMRDGG